MNNKELIEEWKEYNGYKVSNYGKVINKGGKILTTNTDCHGYVVTSIIDYGGKKIKGMHRIVATVFIPNPNNLPEVNHIDGNKENNKVDNLEWCTHDYNMKHQSEVLQRTNGDKHYHNVVTEEQAIEIYNLCKEGDLLYKEIAEMYGVFPQEVSRIATMRKWKCLGFEPIILVRGSRGKTRQKPVRLK
jgi:hypothetical protein